MVSQNAISAKVKPRILPLMINVLTAFTSYIVYYQSYRIPNKIIHHNLAGIFGLIYVISIFVGPMFIFTIAYLENASLIWCILYSILVPTIWMVKDILVLLESFPLIECLYWIINPMYIFFICLLSVEMGVGTFCARYFLKLRGGTVKVISHGPLAAILVGIIVSVSIFAWGQGENMFSLYLDGYRYIFGF
jgi:hypothetical protein